MAEQEETSHQHYDKIQTKTNYINATTQDIMKCSEETPPNLQDMNKEVDALSTNPMILVEIENDLRDIEKDFTGDRDLEAFKMKYEKLYQGLRDSMENENKLAKKSKEINAEMCLNFAKVQTALKLTHEYINDAGNIKQDIHDVWASTDKLQKREKEILEKIDQAGIDIKDQEVQQAEGIQNAEMENQMKLNKKIRKRDEVQKIVQTKVSELTEIRAANTLYLQEITNFEHGIQKSYEFIGKLKADKDKIDEDTSKFSLQKKQLENQIENLRQKNEQKTEELKDIKFQIEENKNLVLNYQDTIKLKMKEKETTKEELSKREKKIKSLKKEIDQCLNAIENMKTQIEKQDEEIRKKNQDMTGLDRDLKKADRDRNEEAKKQKEIQYDKDHQKQKKEYLESILTLEKETLAEKARIVERVKENHETEMKKRATMELKLKQEKNKIFYLNEEYMMLESKAKKLENQVKGYKIEAQKLNKQINILQHQQEKYGIEASTAHARYYQTVEELKIKNNIIADLQKKNSDLESKLKHQQNLYEAVRSDRNLYSKNQLEAQEEIEDLNKKWRRMTHQIEQHKDEIKSKNARILRENKNLDIVQCENQETINKKDIVSEKIKSTEDYIKHHDNQISKQKFFIGEAQNEKQKQLKDYEMVLNERDILCAQLIKRRQEIQVLYEKIKISESKLTKGELCFRERQSEFIELKNKLEGCRKEYTNTDDQIACIKDFECEINNLNKELLKEKTKVRALTDELKYPMNVHRWRKMEATDPENYERIMKIQTQQRRLISKTEEVEEKEKLIKQKEKLFMELKNILSRQPGPEVYEQIQIYKSSLKDKTSQFKKMLNELKEAQDQVKATKYEIGLMKEEIGKLKQGYFGMRDREEREKLKNVVTEYPQSMPIYGGYTQNVAPISLT